MTTLEQAFAQMDGFNIASVLAYHTKRNEAVARISAYIEPLMKEPAFALRTAGEIMDRAEECGRIDGDSVAGELSARYAKSGRPIPFTI